MAIYCYDPCCCTIALTAFAATVTWDYEALVRLGCIGQGMGLQSVHDHVGRIGKREDRNHEP